MKRLVVALAAAGLALTVGAAVWLAEQLEAVAADPAPRLFEIQSGESLGRVARRLEQAGLVRSAFATKLLARHSDSEGRLQKGEYELSPHQSPREILDVFVSGRVKTWPVVIPEGLRASEIASRLEEAGIVEADAFMALVSDVELATSLGVGPASLEGYLFPETYQLPRGVSAETLVTAMVRQFLRVWQELEPMAREQGLSMHEVVTLASIVEKETGVPGERPLIASVFLNRLRRGMRLETDPTVIYGIADFDGNLRKQDLLDATNPYNTYRIRGLPPGPIANPGAEALRAVLQPAESDYLYFVSRNDGTHQFSSSYAEHVQAVDRFQRRRRPR